MSTLRGLPTALASVPVYPQRLVAEELPGALRSNPLVAELLAMTPAQEAAFVDRSQLEASEDDQVFAEILASMR